MKITDIDRYRLSDIIFYLSEQNLSEEACDELAFFLEDVFSDGIEFDRLVLIVQEAKEYASFEELMHRYLNQDEIDEVKADVEEYEGDFEQSIIEKIEEDYSATILRTGNGFVVVE